MIQPTTLDPSKIGCEGERQRSNGAAFQHGPEIGELMDSRAEYLRLRQTSPLLIWESVEQHNGNEKNSCKNGHRALVVEVLNEEGRKVYRRWCSRCLKLVAPDTPTRLL